MNTIKEIKNTVFTQYWGQVITFIAALAVMFAFMRATLVFLGQ